MTYDNAETTTTGGPVRADSARTMAIKRRIASWSATEVPPNFITTLRTVPHLFVGAPKTPVVNALHS